MKESDLECYRNAELYCRELEYPLGVRLIHGSFLASLARENIRITLCISTGDFVRSVQVGDGLCAGALDQPSRFASYILW